MRSYQVHQISSERLLHMIWPHVSEIYKAARRISEIKVNTHYQQLNYNISIHKTIKDCSNLSNRPFSK